MAHDRALYKLQRDGRTVRCDSAAAVSALLAMGWTLIEPLDPQGNLAVALAASMRDAWRRSR